MAAKMKPETESPFKGDEPVEQNGVPEAPEKVQPVGMVARALEVVRDTKRVSLSILERKLDLSLEKASMLLDHLEKHNIIAGPDGEKKTREILIDLDAPLPEVPELLALVPKPVTRNTRKKLVDCELTDTEIAEAAQEMVKARDELAAKAEELKAFKEEHKEEVSVIKARESHFAGMVRDKVEPRDLECEIILDYEQETYTAIRKDTGETVEERPMTSSELSDLPLEG